jgi:hypothetical protein
LLLSVDGIHNPLRDVRSIQVDFRASSAELQVGSFTWTLDLSVSDANYVQFFEPVPSITYLGTGRVDGFILDLSSTPRRVATVDVTVNGSGVLTVQSAGTNSPSSATVVSAGFDSPVIFSSSDGNLGGGSVSITIDDNPAPDSDGDGLADAEDAFPLDPTETTDTDGDGAGDVADTDDDEDGVPDVSDPFPLDDSETADTDGDGIGDNADADDDGDGVADVDDAFPLDPDRTTDPAGGGGGGATGGSLCGVAMLSTLVFLSLGLGGLRMSVARFARSK